MVIVSDLRATYRHNLEYHLSDFDTALVGNLDGDRYDLPRAVTRYRQFHVYRNRVGTAETVAAIHFFKFHLCRLLVKIIIVLELWTMPLRL